VVVADTDVLIDALEHAREPVAAQVRRLLERGELATTAINLFELTSGSSTSVDRLEQLHAFLGPVLVLPVTRGAADISASAHRYLQRKGAALAVPDMLIAGVCIAHGYPLLTRNVDHFGRVPGLELSPAAE
jgi:tRNA(fMet)-specific endonuclease VapC